jgi:hypothetical protein
MTHLSSREAHVSIYLLEEMIDGNPNYAREA